MRLASLASLNEGWIILMETPACSPSAVQVLRMARRRSGCWWHAAVLVEGEGGREAKHLPRCGHHALFFFFDACCTKSLETAPTAPPHTQVFVTLFCVYVCVLVCWYVGELWVCMQWRWLVFNFVFGIASSSESKWLRGNIASLTQKSKYPPDPISS